MSRLTTDINKIIIHHTGTTLKSTGEAHNKDHALLEEFGSPFDILVNDNGKIDLSPQWIYAIDSMQYVKDVHFNRIIQTTSHHLAKIGKTLEEKQNMVHVAVVGDFNNRKPSPFQVNGLLSVIEQLCKSLGLCVKHSLFYYSELYLNSSPGIYFPSKASLIASLFEKKTLQNLC
jgi:hypothetical protein